MYSLSLKSKYNHYFSVFILSLHFSWQFFIQSSKDGYKPCLWCIIFFLGRKFFPYRRTPKNPRMLFETTIFFCPALKLKRQGQYWTHTIFFNEKGGVYFILFSSKIVQTEVRGRPSFSSFSLMIISIIRGGRGLKNDDKYHNLFMVQISWKCKKKGH